MKGGSLWWQPHWRMIGLCGGRSIGDVNGAAVFLSDKPARVRVLLTYRGVVVSFIHTPSTASTSIHPTRKPLLLVGLIYRNQPKQLARSLDPSHTSHGSQLIDPNYLPENTDRPRWWGKNQERLFEMKVSPRLEPSPCTANRGTGV